MDGRKRPGRRAMACGGVRGDQLGRDLAGAQGQIAAARENEGGPDVDDAHGESVLRNFQSGSRNLTATSSSNSGVSMRSAVLPRAYSSLSQRTRITFGMVATCRP